ncbi:MAG: zinc ribbon domain-containing protein [Clostridia bacterium]|nr:zinc ribbon domain-containing protein [Clostridia bacterium]MBQ4618971.1 zinc ribbon domain-containing protein [Clostridia bacterium]
MPMYSFFCPECGRQFEELLSMKDKDFALCPDCGAKGERQWMGKRNFIRKTESSPCANAETCASCMCPHARG